MRTSILLLAIGALAACSKAQPSSETRTTSVTTPAAPSEAVKVSEGELAVFAPLPASFDRATTSDAKIALGRMLYFEPRLSLGQAISCNTCHDLARYGVDGERVSTGHRGQLGTRNSPTVLNAAGQFAQFWDGREPDVEAQAKGPMMNPLEMAMPKAEIVISTLKSIPAYEAAFVSAFPGERPAITLDHATAAIGAFERRLVTPSRWDRFLRGDRAALSDDEKIGFNTFFDAGCPTCHGGTLVGGMMFQKLGAVAAWPDTHDEGRYAITKQESDRMMFKVPSLRNVAKTAPYFHDGSVATLPEAVRLMARHQLGRRLNDVAIARIVTWLGALTGDVPTDLARPPELPPSGPRTPKPARE